MSEDKKYQWGRFKSFKGKMTKQFIEEFMTREEMIEFDETFRHMSKEVEVHDNNQDFAGEEWDLNNIVMAGSYDPKSITIDTVKKLAACLGCRVVK